MTKVSEGEEKSGKKTLRSHSPRTHSHALTRSRSRSRPCQTRSATLYQTGHSQLALLLGQITHLEQGRHARATSAHAHGLTPSSQTHLGTHSLSRLVSSVRSALVSLSLPPSHPFPAPPPPLSLSRQLARATSSSSSSRASESFSLPAVVARFFSRDCQFLAPPNAGSGFRMPQERPASRREGEKKEGRERLNDDATR